MPLISVDQCLIFSHRLSEYSTRINYRKVLQLFHQNGKLKPLCLFFFSRLLRVDMRMEELLIKHFLIKKGSRILV